MFESFKDFFSRIKNTHIRKGTACLKGCGCTNKKQVMIKAGCRLQECKVGHVFVKGTTGEEECVYLERDGDRMVTIIHPVAPENDGFTGHLSTRNAFGEDTISEQGSYASVCWCVMTGHGQWQIAIN